jgi:glutamine amidotransferase
MLLEPMYMLMGRNFEHDETSYDFEVSGEEKAEAAIFASEPLTDGDDGWDHLEFGEIVFLEKDGEHVSRTVNKLKL